MNFSRARLDLYLFATRFYIALNYGFERSRSRDFEGMSLGLIFKIFWPFGLLERNFLPPP